MTAAAPTFSVIVPAFNSVERIGGVLASVLAQTRSDLELIVVDDGSSDGTAERVERLADGEPRLRLIRQPNTGTVGARNAGIDAAAGSYVSFLDDDDLWMPDYLERVARPLEGDPGIGIAYSDAWVLNARSGRVGHCSALDRFAGALRRMPARLDARTALRALLRVNFMSTCTVTVSAAALRQVGGLDPDIPGCDDWDLWLRIAGAGYGLARVGGRPVVQRKRSDSVGSDRLLMARGSRLVLDAALARGVRDPVAARIARRHRKLVTAEIEALERGSRGLAMLTGAARRLGRKRALRRRGERPAPASVQALLQAPAPTDPGPRPY